MEFTLFLDKSGQHFKLRGIDLGAKGTSIDPRVRCQVSPFSLFSVRFSPVTLTNLGIQVTWASIHDFAAQSFSQVWNTAPVAASKSSDF